ncbi:FAD binding domain protein [Usnea florida]
MHPHLILLLAASSLNLGEAATTTQIPFSELFASLVDLGYSQAVPTASSLNDMTGFNASSGCARTCQLLGLVLPNITSQIGSPSYARQEETYWSNQQAETQPRCRTQPQSAHDVSTSLFVTKSFNCPFAVKSGGHAMFAGASNIQDGLTIDLAQLNQIQVSPDKTRTVVGSGARWGDVYSHLDERQLSVVGGRDADIGVGGLTLGGIAGGISFFSGLHGFACDNVLTYEVVLANGTIAHVDHTSHPDLYFALRGGGNNFGVVTTFTLATFPQGQMWGGTRTYALTQAPALLTALVNFSHMAPTSPSAAFFLSFSYMNGTYHCFTSMDYAEPIINPPIFHELSSIASLTSSMRTTTITNLTQEIHTFQPAGYRETYVTCTFKPDVAFQQRVLDMFKAATRGITDAKGVLPAVTMQPITTNTIAHFRKNGGNALGIEEGDGPLILVDISISWSSPTDDARITLAANTFIANAVAAAKTAGLNYKYIYQNYAAAGQDVFGGYGEANRERLIEISRAYDPSRVFEKLQPGYFKVEA